MFSKEEEARWRNWFLQKVTTGNTVARLKLEKFSFTHRFQFMLAGMFYRDGRPIFGVVTYNSENSEHLDVRNGHLAFLPPKVETDTNAYRLAKNHVPFQSEWMTDALALCVYRELWAKERLRPISMDSILSLRYLSKMQGMLDQAAAVAVAGDKKDFICAMEAGLSVRLARGYRELGSLVAGLS